VIKINGGIKYQVFVLQQLHPEGDLPGMVGIMLCYVNDADAG
jgi:hypothetical protein